MKRTLKLEIDCGTTTCATRPGKFCKHIRTRKFGSVHFCHVFHDVDHKGKVLPLEEKDGWVQRHPECMSSEAL